MGVPLQVVTRLEAKMCLRVTWFLGATVELVTGSVVDYPFITIGTLVWVVLCSR